MRKNVKKQLALRVLSTAALVAMVSSIATAAFAAEYNVKDGSVEIVAKDGVQSITQWADKDDLVSRISPYVRTYTSIFGKRVISLSFHIRNQCKPEPE